MGTLWGIVGDGDRVSGRARGSVFGKPTPPAGALMSIGAVKGVGSVKVRRCETLRGEMNDPSRPTGLHQPRGRDPR